MKYEESRLEADLLQFRPRGLPSELRRHIFGPMSRRRRWSAFVGWAAVAAMLAGCVLFDFAGKRIDNEIGAMLKRGGTVWTQEAEEMAQMLNGEGWGRRYIALALSVEPRMTGNAPMHTNKLLSGQI